jgi:hypothetical protein
MPVEQTVLHETLAIGNGVALQEIFLLVSAAVGAAM